MADPDDMFTIQPDLRSRMPGRTSWQRCMAA